MARRLAAILAADVVGYSRLMGQDERGTLERLKALRKEVVQPKISEHGGRIVKLMGDGLLAEFPSVVEAVESAVDIQQAMHGREPNLPDERRIILRIGINLGDVMVEGSDLYGDGVNVAARLEALAEPGGICLSGPAFDMVDGKLDIAFEDAGEQQLKNIAKRVRVYRLPTQGIQDAPSAPSDKPSRTQNRPSIAVLPFMNMSGDPEQQYFSDGITEDIITELSRFRNLLVLARSSVFQHRGAVDVKAIARSLGVQYVVEGSVRRLGSRIRITAQLLEATTGNHLWAERYDRDIEDLFAVQDEVTQAIAATVEGRMAASGAQRSRHKPTEDLVAYDYFLQGREIVEQLNEIDAAIIHFRRAIELDPEFAQAYAWLSRSYTYRYHLDLSAETLGEALDLARKAVSLDDADAWCHTALGYAYLFGGQNDLAGVHLDRAVALNPTDSRILSMQALWLAFMGRTDDAVRTIDLALRRDPFMPGSHWTFLATTLFQAGRYEDTINAAGHLLKPKRWDLYYLAACHAHLGQIEKARSYVAELLRDFPDTSLRRVGLTERYKNSADLDRLLDGLRRAGLPE